MDRLNISHGTFMEQALVCADEAERVGEVPVGAVVVYQDKVIAQAHNESISRCDPSGHAEVLALRAAAAQLGNYRLVDTTLYVTLEPCLMCAGLLAHARVARCVFGAYDHKAGALVSHFQVFQQNILNHRVEIIPGILAEACAAKLTHFFRARRGG